MHKNNWGKKKKGSIDVRKGSRPILVHSIIDFFWYFQNNKNKAKERKKKTI